MKIPSNNAWSQLNEGLTSGVLSMTQNTALDTAGQIKLSKRPVAIISSVDNDDFRYLQSLVYFANNYIAVTSDGLFSGGLSGSEWTEETQFTPNTTGGSDAIVFNGRLVVTTNSNIDDWDGAFDDRSGLASLTSSVPHPMAIFDSLPTYKLAVGNGRQLKTYDTDFNPNTTILTLPSQFVITTLAYRNGYMYIGTKTTDGSEARVFIWNGSGSNAQYECPVGAEWVYSIIPYGSTVVCITNSGQLLQISGSSAVQMAALPVYAAPHALWQQDSGIPRVYHRGMVAVGKNIYINLEGEVENGFIPEQKTGLWVFDPSVGLYHRATSSTDTLVSDNGLTLSDSVITTSAPHNLKEGDAVQFRSVNGIGGADVNLVYYSNVVSDTEIKLALSRKGLNSGNYVKLTGTPGLSDILFYFPNTDGGSQDCRAGAVAATTINERAKESVQAEIFWGSRSRNESGDTVYTLNTFHDSCTSGAFATQRVYTANIQQVWKEIYMFLDGIVLPNEKAVVKARTKSESKAILLDGVWSTTNIISTEDVKKTAAWADIEVGDELVIYDGKAQGKTVHVTNISNSATVFNLTVDESIGVIGESSKFYKTNYKKMGTWNSTNKKNEFFKQTLTNTKSPWINIKVDITGNDIAVNMLELANEIHKGTQ
jgi:hypothetical protein